MKRQTKQARIAELEKENRRLETLVGNLKRSFELRAQGQRDTITKLRSDDGWIENAAKHYLDLVQDDGRVPYSLNARELLATIFVRSRDGYL